MFMASHELTEKYNAILIISLKSRSLSDCLKLSMKKLLSLFKTAQSSSRISDSYGDTKKLIDNLLEYIEEKIRSKAEKKGRRFEREKAFHEQEEEICNMGINNHGDMFKVEKNDRSDDEKPKRFVRIIYADLSL